MTLSDFPRSAALLSEGFCPLCEEKLDGDRCEGCDVGWSLGEIAGRTAVSPSRTLRSEEVRKLYARDSEVHQ